MNAHSLLESYKARILECMPTADSIPANLLIETHGDLKVYYAPFDHVNTAAKLVLVGITPGVQQAVNALKALRAELQNGATEAEALAKAKTFASFSGPMRKNLVDMLDSVGLARWLGVDSTIELFGARSELVHFTSALRYPVLYRGKNYSGAPSMIADDLLRNNLSEYFAEEARLLPDAIFVPLGPKVREALDYVSQQGYIDPARILGGLPHPSGANAERIAYFLGRKHREALSIKVNPDVIDTARAEISAKMRKLVA